VTQAHGADRNADAARAEIEREQGRVRAESEEPNPETYPAWARVTYEFPDRGPGLPPVTLTWYEGHRDGQLVRPPAELTAKVVAEYNKLLGRRGDKQVAEQNGHDAPDDEQTANAQLGVGS